MILSIVLSLFLSLSPSLSLSLPLSFSPCLNFCYLCIISLFVAAVIDYILLINATFKQLLERDHSSWLCFSINISVCLYFLSLIHCG